MKKITPQLLVYLVIPTVFTFVTAIVSKNPVHDALVSHVWVFCGWYMLANFAITKKGFLNDLYLSTCFALLITTGCAVIALMCVDPSIKIGLMSIVWYLSCFLHCLSIETTQEKPIR